MISESLRRKPEASGYAISLGLGEDWLLKIPEIRLGASSLTSPPIDDKLNLIFDQTILLGYVDLCLVFEVLRILLLANYDISDQEFSDLTSLPSGDPCNKLVDNFMKVVFGDLTHPQQYSDWIRVCFTLNHLTDISVNPTQLHHVLQFLTTTCQVPTPTEFIDSMRISRESMALESLL